MPRPLRNIGQGKTHHCYTRCHNKNAFLKTGMGETFLIKAVLMCQEKYDFEIASFENSGNHIHLIIRTFEGKETISRIMQYIKARTAQIRWKSILSLNG
jgi:REP element-mobilizing transposase RayT